MRVSVALPAYDEVENLEAVVREAREVLAQVPGRGEVLVVDDGSRDGTGALADALAARYPDVRVVHHARNRGFSGAILTCLREARGEWVFLAAADGQTPIAELGRFLERAAAADIVVGVRERRHEGLDRKLLSRAFHLVARALLALPQREFSSAFLFRRALVDAMPLRSRPRAATLLPEVLFRARRRGAAIAQLTVTQRPRRAGRAKGGQLSVGLVTLLELLRLALLLRLDKRRHAAPATVIGAPGAGAPVWGRGPAGPEGAAGRADRGDFTRHVD